MGDNNSAEEPTNFPVGNEDEVPSESPEKVQTPAAAPDPKVVPNDTPEEDVQAAKDARNAGTPAANDAGGDSIQSPSDDPNRANARPAAEQADKKL
jgi:hypothetical protein